MAEQLDIIDPSYLDFCKMSTRGAYVSLRIDCSCRDPGCLVCELDLWGYDGKTVCYCKRLAGDWSQEFVNRIESFHPGADEDLYEDEDEDEDEDLDEDLDKEQDEEEDKDEQANLTQDQS
ncbi:hypothetical protein KCU77_g16689, partial [Aureobasidium melanogenum]